MTIFIKIALENSLDEADVLRAMWSTWNSLLTCILCVISYLLFHIIFFREKIFAASCSLLAALICQVTCVACPLTMSTTTPLLSLLDSVLSNDVQRIQQARKMVAGLVQGLPLDTLINEKCSDCPIEDDVRKLLTAFPHLAFVPNVEDGSLPLHSAALIGNVGIAKIVMENFSIAASSPDSKGMTPLHYAAREGFLPMVTLFLQVTPQSAQIKCCKKKLALHLASAEGHTEVVKHLLRVDPQSSSRRSAKGKLPLHYAACSGSMEVVSDLLVAYPDGIHTLDWEGSLPLHEAATEGEIEMFKFLLERFPTGISRKNMRGETPLFSAVRSDNVDLVILCLSAWPHGGQHVLKEAKADDRVCDWDPVILELCLRSAYGVFDECDLVKEKVVKDKELQLVSGMSTVLKDGEGCDAASLKSGDVSLPITTSSSSSTENVRKRLLSYIDLQEPTGIKKSAKCREKPGRVRRNSLRALSDSNLSDDEKKPEASTPKRTYMPLHAALDCGVSSAVLQCVLDGCSKEELTKKDEYGQFPLHLAVAHCREEDEIQILLERILKPYPEASKIPDMHGRLPVHVAVVSRADVRIILGLLEANPTSTVETVEKS